MAHSWSPIVIKQVTTKNVREQALLMIRPVEVFKALLLIEVCKGQIQISGIELFVNLLVKNAANV